MVFPKLNWSIGIFKANSLNFILEYQIKRIYRRSCFLFLEVQRIDTRTHTIFTLIEYQPANVELTNSNQAPFQFYFAFR